MAMVAQGPWACPMRQMELVTVCLRALQQSNCLLREKDEQELRAIKAERQVERLMMANTPAGTPIAGGDAVLELTPELRKVSNTHPVTSTHDG